MVITYDEGFGALGGDVSSGKKGEKRYLISLRESSITRGRARA